MNLSHQANYVKLVVSCLYGEIGLQGSPNWFGRFTLPNNPRLTKSPVSDSHRFSCKFEDLGTADLALFQFDKGRVGCSEGIFLHFRQERDISGDL